MRYFKKNGWIVKLDRDHLETEESFILRGYFIVSQKPTENQLKDLINASRVLINIKYNECKYSQELHDKIDKLEQNLYE